MSFNQFRVTHNMLAANSLANLQRNMTSLADLQDQISSLKRIRTPSDDPIGAVSALGYRSQVGRRDQIDRNLDDARAWLATADSALQGILDQVNRARDLAIQGRNAALGASERAALAQEVDQLRQQIIGLANTKYLDRAVFAGNARTGAAYDVSGAYLGDAGAVERTIAPGQRLAVNVTGDAVFGPAGASLFDTLIALSAALRGDPSQIDAVAADLDAGMQRVQNQLTDVGARARRVDDSKTRNGLQTDDLRRSLSEVEDVDLTKALVELQIQQGAYQAALAATARSIQPSLVDFLR
jgi:flagellar hook-associated protein 3 FlgL